MGMDFRLWCSESSFLSTVLAEHTFSLTVTVSFEHADRLFNKNINSNDLFSPATSHASSAIENPKI